MRFISLPEAQKSPTEFASTAKGPFGLPPLTLARSFMCGSLRKYWNALVRTKWQ
jgi:hypothetical protein